MFVPKVPIDKNSDNDLATSQSWWNIFFFTLFHLIKPQWVELKEYSMLGYGGAAVCYLVLLSVDSKTR